MTVDELYAELGKLRDAGAGGGVVSLEPRGEQVVVLTWPAPEAVMRCRDGVWTIVELDHTGDPDDGVAAIVEWRDDVDVCPGAAR